MSEASIRKFHKQQPISRPSGIQKEELPEYKQLGYLKGARIWVRKAEEKYNIPSPTISIWVKKGFIASLGRDGNKIILNEQDVAFCAKIYHSHRGQGKWLFNSNGTPYVPRSEKVQVSA